MAFTNKILPDNKVRCIFSEKKKRDVKKKMLVATQNTIKYIEYVLERRYNHKSQNWLSMKLLYRGGLVVLL